MTKRQKIWAVKEHGMPDWDRYVGYSFDDIEKRINTLKEMDRPHEIKVYNAGQAPQWEH